MKSIILSVVLLFVVVNLGVVYYIVLFGDVPKFAQRLDLLERRVDSIVKRDGDVTKPEVEVVDDESLVVLSDQQEEELAQLAGVLLENKLEAMVADEVTKQLSSGVSDGSVKEYFIPLGGAKVQTEDNNWVNTGLQAEVDLSRYAGKKKVYLEGTLKVPTGNGLVQARLVDSVNGMVGGSEIGSSSSQGNYVKSGALEIFDGLRVLSVQMRTSLNYEGVAVGLRIKIEMEN